MEASWDFFGADTKNWQKRLFFVKFPSIQHFCTGKFFRDRTMWKLTSWGFRKCGSFWARWSFLMGVIAAQSQQTWRVQKIKIVAVSFFCYASYFWWRTRNFKVCWLWAAITPVKKLARPKSTTFSETSGPELSHGPILFPSKNIEEKGF